MRALSTTLLLALGACGPAVEPPPEPRPNLLVIAVDTLRADALGCYGAPGDPTPAIDALAADGALFLDAVSASSWTLPSFATLATGYPTTTHGCWSFTTALDPSFDTLAERLLREGYDTAAVVSHVFLGREYGLSQGFVHYDDELVLELGLSDEAISSPAVSDEGVAFLEAKAAADDGRPWFLFLHYFDPHEDYLAHAAFPAATDEDRDLYAAEVRFTDHHVGRVLQALEAGGLADDTVVVFTADHGEEFGEHGGRGHGETLWVEQLHVPLAIRAPGIAPGEVDATVRTLDVLPTLLELLALPAEPDLPGASLADAMRGAAIAPRPALSELNRAEAVDLVSVVEGRWKLLLDRATDEVTLYDRTADPGETADVAAAHPDVAARLRGVLDAALGRARDAAQGYSHATLSLHEGQLADLRATGYVDG